MQEQIGLPRDDGFDGYTPVLIVAVLVIVAATIWAFSGTTRFETGPSGQRLDPRDVYNPVTAGEQLPSGYRQLLARDAILPIYDPIFVNAAESDWSADTEVLGIEIGGQAKAYPIASLNGRELVVDELDGIPILVSW